MARITMRNSQKATFAQVFELYISAVTARGVKDKTIATYKQHFHAISKRLDVSLPINRLNSTVLDKMILRMRGEGLSDSSINSYTRTLKCFLTWCNEEGYDELRNMEIPRYLMQVRYGSTYSKVKHIRVYSYFSDAILFPDGSLWRDVRLLFAMT